MLFLMETYLCSFSTFWFYNMAKTRNSYQLISSSNEYEREISICLLNSSSCQWQCSIKFQYVLGVFFVHIHTKSKNILTQYSLTHWDRVTHICVSKLTIIRSASSHYLNQSWIIVNLTLRNKLQWNCNQNSNIFIEENTFENVVCEKAAILSRPQCVKV